ncbi:MAG: DUF1015 domain-containing protein [Acidobacteriia bacterium]|nr:DUF1015 domain-containing protein [Terriglobia bacterium]
MAHIEPFRALRYDPTRVSIPQVVTQPYDKITPEMQDGYYAASPQNLVRIILGKEHASDHSGENRYTRAAQFFRGWRRQGIFLQDAQPSLYLYVQRFTVPGGTAELERRGIIALGRIEDYSAGVVFRHEQTLAKPKADRLELLRATRAHFGQLFMLYSDPAGEIESLLAPGGKPDLETLDEYAVSHRIWKISDPGLVNLVRGKMRDKKLVIADGHHRYETALNYRNERRAAARPSGTVPRERASLQNASDQNLSSPSDPAAAPYELVMMTLVNMDSPGMVILPTHRVVHGLTSFSSTAFRTGASAYFSVEEVDAAVDAARATVILREAGRMGTALLAVTSDRVFLLDRPKAVAGEIFAGWSLRQQALDVVQLHKCLLEGVLGISEEAIREQKNVRYIRDIGEAMAQVRSGTANVAFLMNPVRMAQVRDIAFAGEVLPQKSTDFYPKLLTGLTIYALE